MARQVKDRTPQASTPQRLCVHSKALSKLSKQQKTASDLVSVSWCSNRPKITLRSLGHNTRPPHGLEREPQLAQRSQCTASVLREPHKHAFAPRLDHPVPHSGSRPRPTRESPTRLVRPVLDDAQVKARALFARLLSSPSSKRRSKNDLSIGQTHQLSRADIVTTRPARSDTASACASTPAERALVTMHGPPSGCAAVYFAKG